MRRRLPALLSLLLLLAPGGAEAGLRAHYPFDTGFNDVSGNNNHLTVAAGTPAITFAAGETAVGGGAAKFVSTEGDQDSLLLTSPLTFSASDAWSVAFWGRRAAGSTNRQGMVIGDLGSSDFIWLSNGGGGVSGMRFRNSSGASYNNGAAADNAFPDDGGWHHWVLVADGAGSLTVYRDNVSLGTVSAVTTFNATHVGQAFNSNAQSMNGQIDELYIFDEAIDAAMAGDLFAAAGGSDTTPPTLSPGDIVDSEGGSPVVEDSAVAFTVTFSEAMDAGTVSAADFGNAGSSPVDFGAVSEISPGVFSVAVTPTAPGSLQLEVTAGATLADLAGNPLDTASAISDDTTITVEASGGPDTTPPTLSPGDIVDNQGGGPVVEDTEVTFSVTFSEDMDANTVSAADFGNAGSASVIFGAVSEISPGVFSVAVTPTAPGSLQLEVMAGAALADAAGNPLDTTTAIMDGTMITVNSASGPPQVGRLHVFLVGGQSNADGRANPSGLPTSPVDLGQPQDDVDFYENEAGGLTTLRPLSQFGPEITLGRRLADNIGDETRVLPLFDRQPGRVNINTAGAELIERMIEARGMPLEIAEELIFLRSGKPEGLLSELEFRELQGFEENMMPVLTEMFGTQSNVFVISARGRSEVSGAESEIIVVVDRSTLPVRILEYREQ